MSELPRQAPSIEQRTTNAIRIAQIPQNSSRTANRPSQWSKTLWQMQIWEWELVAPQILRRFETVLEALSSQSRAHRLVADEPRIRDAHCPVVSKANDDSRTKVQIQQGCGSISIASKTLSHFGRLPWVAKHFRWRTSSPKQFRASRDPDFMGPHWFLGAASSSQLFLGGHFCKSRN